MLGIRPRIRVFLRRLPPKCECDQLDDDRTTSEELGSCAP